MNNPFFISKFVLPLFIATALLAAPFTAIKKVEAATITHDAIVSLTNTARVNRGEVMLRENAALNRAAMAKAQNMLALDYFNHYGPRGITPWNFILRSGYDYSLAGENLAMDFATPEGVTNAWLNSPTHAKNIYNDQFTDIGVAVVKGNLDGHETILVVQMFGRKQVELSNLLDSPLVLTIDNLLGL